MTTHYPVQWYDTPNELLTASGPEARTWTFSFFGYWKKDPGGIGPSPVAPPTSALAAVSEAIGDGAQLAVDAVYVGPTGTFSPFGSWVLKALNVKRIDDTNTGSDVVWQFDVVCELADLPYETLFPFVDVAVSVTSTNVSAWRVEPSVPTDNWTSIATVDATWHSVTDIGGIKVDWSGQPIQYPLPVTTYTVSIIRAAPYWINGTTRSAGALVSFPNIRQYVGYRNTEPMGYMGAAGEVMFMGANTSPVGNGLYQLSYQFKQSPWKHAIQVPYVIGGQYLKSVNANNGTRTHNDQIWWSQPHLQGENFKDFAVLGITSYEWQGANVT